MNDQLNGFTVHNQSTARKVTTADRIVATDQTGNVQVLQVLLIRDDTIVCALSTDKPGKYRKITLGFNKVESDLPVLSGGSTYQLYVPEGSEAPVQVVDAPIVEQPAKKRGRNIEGPTKLDKCKQLFATNPGADKLTMMALFQSEAGCTVQGSSTYWYLCKKG